MRNHQGHLSYRYLNNAIKNQQLNLKIKITFKNNECINFESI